MAEVDPRFRQMGRGARRRRRRGLLLRAGAAVVLGTGLVLWSWPWLQGQISARFSSDQEMVQVGSQFDVAPLVRVDTFTDIAGDPIIIPPPGEDERAQSRHVPVPSEMAAAGLPMRVAALQVVEGPLMPHDRQIVASLPSTREEFALFQAERSGDRLTTASLVQSPDQMAGQMAANAASGVMLLRPAVARSPLWRDLILKTVRDTKVQPLLVQNGFDAATADLLARRIQTQLGRDGTLTQGSVLALRWRPRDGGRQVIQLSLYGPGGYQGSLALSAAGQLTPSADPWVDQSLLRDAMDQGDGPAPAGQQRLLDMIYSAALRNDVPPEIIGQAMSLMSQVHDLDAYADPQDRLTLIFADGDGGDPGAILFVGVTGRSGDKSCYVVPSGQGTRCHAPDARLRHVAGAGLMQPVGGVLSQRFVPPGKDEDATMASGRGQVVWTAPKGSPVLAAEAGVIDAVQSGLIQITHDDGLVSRYAGLDPVAAELEPGKRVARGAVIGQAGVPPGRSQPGLALQILRGGQPVDPMALLGGGTEVLASDAIESLIGHIIRVESAGVADARNPRSTATGLGQFIESTWLRMMGSYRPDLMAALNRGELLDLRLDPALSRQMVRHLAQENEAFLRARGHAVSPGRLYLAHFLGPGGADQALRADQGVQVETVLGSAVVSANPFLRKWTIAQLRNWADRKMGGPSDHAILPDAVPQPPLSPPLRAMVEALERLRDNARG